MSAPLVLGCSLRRPRADFSQPGCSLAQFPPACRPGALCLLSTPLIPSRQMFSSTGSPESPLRCSGAALSRHLPDCRLEPSSCESSPGDKGKLHCLHSYRQGRMLLSLGLIGFPFPFLLTSPHPRNQSCFSKRLAAHVVMWCGIYCAAVLSAEEGVMVSVTIRIPHDRIETPQCSWWQILPL